MKGKPLPSKILCPKCGCSDSRTVDSRGNLDGSSIRRRRECDGCEDRFTTKEFLVTSEGVERAIDPTHDEAIWTLRKVQSLIDDYWVRRAKIIRKEERRKKMRTRYRNKILGEEGDAR